MPSLFNGPGAVAFSLAFASIAGAVTDITFFAASDTHYGRVFGNAYDSLRIVTVANLNALPGTLYPAALGGGPVAVPRGVVMPGDLIDRPYATRWKHPYSGPMEPWYGVYRLERGPWTGIARITGVLRFPEACTSSVSPPPKVRFRPRCCSPK